MTHISELLIQLCLYNVHCVVKTTNKRGNALHLLILMLH